MWSSACDCEPRREVVRDFCQELYVTCPIFRGHRNALDCTVSIFETNELIDCTVNPTINNCVRSGSSEGL